MSVQSSRFGVSITAEYIVTPHVVQSVMLDSMDVDVEITANAKSGLGASVDLFCESDGTYENSDASTVLMDFLIELEGNSLGSLVFPYVQDSLERPARLLSQPVDGLPQPAEKIFRFLSADSAYRISQAQCRGYAETPATEDTILVLTNNGVDVATVLFAAGENYPEIRVSNTNIAIGDRLVFTAAAIQDDTLADFNVVFVLIFVQ